MVGAFDIRACQQMQSGRIMDARLSLLEARP